MKNGGSADRGIGDLRGKIEAVLRHRPRNGGL